MSCTKMEIPVGSANHQNDAQDMSHQINLEKPSRSSSLGWIIIACIASFLGVLGLMLALFLPETSTSSASSVANNAGIGQPIHWKIFSTSSSTSASEDEVHEEKSASLHNAFCETSEPVPIDGSILIGETGDAAGPYDVPECSSQGTPAPGVWYHVTAPSAGHFKVYFDKEEFQRLFKDDGVWVPLGTLVSVYKGGCGELTCVGEPLSIDGHSGSVTWDAVEGSTYEILVHFTPERFGLQVLFTTAQQEEIGHGASPSMGSNYLCERADSIPLDGGSLVGKTAHYMQEQAPLCWQQDTNSTVAPGGTWYNVYVAQGGLHLKAGFVDYFNTQYDARLSIYEGECGHLTCVEDGNFEYDGHLGTVMWASQSQTNYKILVHRTFGEYELYVNTVAIRAN